METKILHPYTYKVKQSNDVDDESDESSKIIESSNSNKNSSVNKSKPFIAYSKTYRKYDSAWDSQLNSYASSPYLDTADYLRARDKKKEGKKEFLLGCKNDVWESLIKNSGSIRTYHSSKYLKYIPDMKIYKKSLEHMLKKNIYHDTSDRS